MAKRRSQNPKVTLADVASEAGVSVSTVSAVLGRKPHCYAAEATKQHIFEVARRIGYRPNLLARSLREQSTKTIGVVIWGLNYVAVQNAKLQSVEDAAWHNGYRILLGAHKDDPKRLEAYFNEFLNRSVDGLVFQPPIPQGQELVHLARATGTPMVTLEAAEELRTWDVGIDYARGTALQAQHVLELGRRPAFIFTSHYSHTGMAKVRGIEQALAKAGRSLDEFPVVEIPRAKRYPRKVVQATEQLLASGWPFDAIITLSDIVAQAAITTLIRCGRRVPDDVAVVGFDDEFDPEGMIVPMTTIRQPREIGPAVFDLLLDQMAHGTGRPPKRISLAPTLVIRESTVSGAGVGPETSEINEDE